MDLAGYRTEAEEFVSALDREYMLHFSGRKDEFAIEAIYDRHPGLFSREVVDGLRAAGEPGLLEFAVEGLIGQSTRGEQAELARREASLEVELPDGSTVPFRESAVRQANEPDSDARASIDAARLELTERELNPLLREVLERGHALAADLGWTSVRSMCEELSGVDLGALSAQTTAFLDATDAGFEAAIEPRLRDEIGLGFDTLRRSDIPAFMRAPSLDESFPAERLLPCFEATLAGLGLDREATGRVLVDVEPRPNKSPRAFCAPVRVPDEVHLVIPQVGGRDDFEALFHEAGHAEHYAHVERTLPFEARYLGDASVTEGFAFLLQHLTADPEWLRRRLGTEDPAPVVDQSRAVKLLMLRRYSAKLAYELELHGEGAALEAMPAGYSERLSRATHVKWPAATWLSDVDPFFYAARYLRAWAFETHLRAMLRERFGVAWFDEPEAGEVLVELWREGQSRPAHELLRDLTGSELRFDDVLLEDVGMGGV